MQRKTRRWLLVLAGLALLLPAQPARALSIALVPLPERVALADGIVIGKVTEIEKKTVSALPFPGAKEKQQFQIALVKVEEGFLGAKGLTHVRIGFMPQPPPPPVNNNGGVIIRAPIGRVGPADLTVGMEGCFVLAQHGEETFCTAQGFRDFVSSQNKEDFSREVDQIRRCIKLLADSTAGLKSKDASDRLLTANMLLTRYRIPRGFTNNPPPKTEPIDAAESRLILNAIIDADWVKGDPQLQVNAQRVFNLLGLTDKDGWTYPKNPADYAPTAKKWLQDHAATYRIQRVVLPKKD